MILSRKIVLAASCFSISALWFSSSYAGFEWRPPEVEQAPAATPVPRITPPPRVASPSNPDFQSFDPVLPTLPPVEKDSMPVTPEQPEKIVNTINTQVKPAQKIVKPSTQGPVDLLSYSDTNPPPQNFMPEPAAMPAKDVAAFKPVQKPAQLKNKKITISASPDLATAPMSSPSVAPESEFVPQKVAAEPNNPNFVPFEAQPEPARARVSAPVLTGQVQNQNFETIFGFGKDIPLALAMRQIVPPSYAFSFAQDVNPGVRISWDGEKPWNIVLKEAIEPHGLEAQITGKRIFIHSNRDSKGLPSLQKGSGNPVDLRRQTIRDPGLNAG